MLHLYDTSAQVLARKIIAAAEQNSGSAMTHLRQLALTDFGELLLSMPTTQYPNLSKILPSTPTPEEQAVWTGASGRELLQDSLSFLRIVTSKFQDVTGRKISDARVLDYGCGFGRLLRIMSYYVDNDKLFAVDPWDQSIAICKKHNVPGTILLSDFLPTSLPLEEQFDLIYSYSVFTHLSERATKAALNTLRKYIVPGGLIALTIREVEFWNQWAPSQGFTPQKTSQLVSDHNMKGFAFEPINLEPIDGDITFGNTSMTQSWIAKEFPAWKIIGYDRGLDYSQTMIYMQPQ